MHFTPLPPSHGYKYILVIVCMFSHWTEDFIGREAIVSSVTKILLEKTVMHWRRKWQPTPAFLPGESQGQESLVVCHLQDRTESDTTEVTQQQQQSLPRELLSNFIVIKEPILLSRNFNISELFGWFYNIFSVLTTRNPLVSWNILRAF